MSHPGHRIEVCICGNVLSQCRCAAPDKLRITRSPCRCEEPGPGSSASPCRDLPSTVSRKQYEERTRLGLPVEADIEKALRREWS